MSQTGVTPTPPNPPHHVIPQRSNPADLNLYGVSGNHATAGALGAHPDDVAGVECGVVGWPFQRDSYSAFRPIMNCVPFRKWRGPSPSGHISENTAPLASCCRSGDKLAVVTPAKPSHAMAKLSISKPSISVSACVSIPASVSCWRNWAGSARAPGPTPGTGGAAAKLPAIF